MKPTVLLITTTRWVPTARLAIALANAGCTVQALCPSRHPLSKTGAVEHIRRYRGLTPLGSLMGAITAAKPDFIVPGDDLATQHLHQLYRREQKRGKAGGETCALIERSLGAARSFPIVYARTPFIELAREEGIRVPGTALIRNTDDLKTWLSVAGFPAVLKADETSGGDGVRIVHTVEEARRAFAALQAPPLLARAAKRAIVDQDKTLVWRSVLRRQSVVNSQTFIVGREATSAIACWEGRVLASLHCEVIRKADSAGHATVVRMIEHPEMASAAEKIVRRLNLSGMHGFDFMIEAGTGNAYLIEINPRATQIGHLALGPGRDLPASLYAAMAGKAVQAAPKVTENDTITLFPQEWIRDPGSPYLRSGYHDVPWQQSELVRFCLGQGSKQRAWYSQSSWTKTFFGGRASSPEIDPFPGQVQPAAVPGKKQDSDVAGKPAPEHSRKAGSGASHGTPLERGMTSARAVLPVSWRAASAAGSCRNFTSVAEGAARGHSPQRRPAHSQVHRNARQPLSVMKFGGTSVGDASCIRRVAEIVRAAACDNSVVVVVSAMSGVTNKLIDAATQSEAGECDRVATIFQELRERHDAAAATLIHSPAKRSQIDRTMQSLFAEGERLCETTMARRELTPQTRDRISSLGERLSAPLVAAALMECGVPSEAIEATELVVTDANHGAADPAMDPTRERCIARLRPLLRQGITPVVTGFIGAAPNGVLTTLGRGGSDYSATILGAALDADEVIIWTDVDGMLTADPRLVPDACSIPAISYQEAADLAHLGAKVLHPKTIRPVMDRNIPLWIRNTFASERAGTKITPTAPQVGEGVKALTSISDVALITLGGLGTPDVSDVLARTLAATATVRADILLTSRSSSQNDICLVITSSLAKSTLDVLRQEFQCDLEHKRVDRITLDPAVAIVTVVSHNQLEISGITGRASRALGREGVKIMAIAEGPSDCNVSFVVARNDVKVALVATHLEFQLQHAGSNRERVNSHK